MSDIVDEKVIEKLLNIKSSGGENFLKELVRIFEDQTPMRIEEIKDAVTEGDCKKIYYLSHTLKSGAGSLGAVKLSSLCARIEREAKAGIVPKQNAVTELKTYFIKSVNYLKSKSVA